MGEVLPFPNPGDTFVDARGNGRTLRISRHPEAGLLILSLWMGEVCRASFRLPADDAPRLLAQLVDAAEMLVEPASDGEPATGQQTTGQQPTIERRLTPLALAPPPAQAPAEPPTEPTAQPSQAAVTPTTGASAADESAGGAPPPGPEGAGGAPATA
jgi:hypothetical protein